VGRFFCFHTNLWDFNPKITVRINFILNRVNRIYCNLTSKNCLINKIKSFFMEFRIVIGNCSNGHFLVIAVVVAQSAIEGIIAFVATVSGNDGSVLFNMLKPSS